jgi:hypothetical protein
MSGTWCQGGFILVNNSYGGSTLNNARLRLFKNNATISTTSVVGDFTESTFPGYAAKLGGLGFSSSAAAIDASGNASQNTGVINWTRATGAGSESLYGYYLVDNASGGLLWAEKFVGGPFTIDTAGQIVSVQLYFIVGSTLE